MPNLPANSPGHVWKFFRRSGLDQVSLETAADLLALGQLDQKLWVALACPVRGLEMDEKTLGLIDSDGDGRIRAGELIAAINWAAARLQDAGDLLKGSASLRYAAIRQDSPEGQAVAAAARLILAQLGKPETGGLSVDETTEPGRIFAPGRLRGDGVIPPEAAPDPETGSVLRDILASVSPAGSAGVTPEQIEAFFFQLEAFAAWSAQGADPAIAVLGERTGAAYAALAAVRAKGDDFFVRCRLADFDPQWLGAVNRLEGDAAVLPSRPLSPQAEEIAVLPLSRIESGKALPLRDGVNPAWAGALSELQRCAVAPILGADKQALTAEEWATLTARFSAYQAWLEAKAGAQVEALGLARAREILGGGTRARLAALVEEDRSLAPGFAAIADLDRLVRYHRDLRTLLRNFVNFADFYSRQSRAVFQAGTLFLDSRSCDLCTRADNPAQHAVLATMGRLYIAYVECRRAGSAALSIAACFTQGDSNYLSVGRNGLFYDRQGRDWDATIVKLVENPISVRQAFFAPYRRVAGFVQEQIAKFAAAKDQAASGNLGQGLAASAQSAEAGKAPNQPFDIAKFAGIFAAIGLAIGAIGGAVASVAVGFMRLTPWQMPLAVAGALLIISGPSILMAAIKLHQRNLGPLLEASGWAVNGRVKINFTLGRLLTQRAVLPPGAKRQLHDPYADKALRRRRILCVVLLLLIGALITAKIQGFWPFSS